MTTLITLLSSLFTLSGLIWVLLLAALWTVLTQLISPANFLVGVLFALLILLTFGRPLFAAPAPPHPAPLLRRTLAILSLSVYFLIQLVIANLKMAQFTVSPLSRLKPGIVAVPLEPMSDSALMVLANLITLTPGTLSVDTSPDHRTLYIHVMSVDDPADVVAEIKSGFERRVLEVMT